ncbi:leucine-rich repeat domain-containing protein [Dictyobacter kobayashii]|uniref:Disease resistance R13L4/SHOC-2-like LRR domain-containing protein n=1 Tax=Dictyobacter kobayashii TaxID=2014872 RepID=A0A402ACG4_9CHLR|nr:leucine-rich repeat domain-containing protein [Dictyobacter kobayashii]GCE16776.1 hypothetical protein KDK_05760 [Dictyobacter kobayashii]
MGWKGYAIFIESITADRALAAFPGAFTFNEHHFDVEDAFSGTFSERLAKGTGQWLAECIISQHHGWVVLLDPHWMTLDWHERGVFERLSQGRRIFAFLMESTSGTYWFWYYVNGVLKRSVYDEDTRRDESGPPLPQEAQITLPWFDEEYLFLLLERVTGWTWERMESLTYVGVDMDHQWYDLDMLHPDEQPVLKRIVEAVRQSFEHVIPGYSLDTEGYLTKLMLAHAPDVSELSSLTHLKELTLDQCQLSPAMWSWQGVEALELKGTGLASLSPQISNLKNLTYLYICEPLLRYLPSEIGQLPNLEYLQVGWTHIQTLPASIGDLTHLRQLILNDNAHLTHLPASIASLTHLERLDLSSAALTQLPPEIARLSSLQTLIVTGSQLRVWPIEITHLPHLRRFEMQETPLCVSEGDGSFDL